MSKFHNKQHKIHVKVHYLSSRTVHLTRNMAWNCMRLIFTKHCTILTKKRIMCVAPASSVFFTKLGVATSAAKNAPQKFTPVEDPNVDPSTVTKAFHKLPEEQQKLSMKYTLLCLGMSVTLLGGYLVYEYSAPQVNEAGEPIQDEFSHYPAWKQYLLRTLKRIEEFTVFIQEPSREKLLPDPVQYPYYQPPYTLILEFTDVLAHPDWTYKTGWRFKKRPGLDYMLENLVGLYEIVVFTAEPGITIFPVIDALDQKNLISYKLVRDSTHFVDGHHVKNLDKLNRDLRKVVVVDWNAESVKFHQDNLLNVQRWRGEDEDSALVDLTSFLKTIAHTEIEDVREVLKFYKQFDDPLQEFRNKQKEYYENEQKMQEAPKGQAIKKVFDYIL